MVGLIEKRFTKCCPKIRDYGEEMSCTEVCDMLNHLNDENEQLKQKNQLLYEDIDFLKRFIEKRGFKAKLESDKK